MLVERFSAVKGCSAQEEGLIAPVPHERDSTPPMEAALDTRYTSFQEAATRAVESACVDVDRSRNSPNGHQASSGRGKSTQESDPIKEPLRLAWATLRPPGAPEGPLGDVQGRCPLLHRSRWVPAVVSQCC